MREIVFRCVSGNTLTWEVDRDTTLVGFNGTTACVLSMDPQLTYALESAPVDEYVSEGLVLALDMGSGQFENLNFPLSKGQTLYLAPRVAGVPAMVVILLEDPPL